MEIISPVIGRHISLLHNLETSIRHQAKAQLQARLTRTIAWRQVPGGLQYAGFLQKQRQAWFCQ